MAAVCLLALATPLARAQDREIWQGGPFTGWVQLEWVSFDAARLSDCAELYTSFDRMAGFVGSWPQTRDFFQGRFGMRSYAFGYHMMFHVEGDRVTGPGRWLQGPHQRESWRFRERAEGGERVCLVPVLAGLWTGSGQPRYETVDSQGFLHGSMFEEYDTRYIVDPRRLRGTVRASGLEYRFGPRGVDVDVLQGCCRSEGACEIVSLDAACPAGSEPVPLAGSRLNAAHEGLCSSCEPASPEPAGGSEPVPGCCRDGFCEPLQPDTCIMAGGQPLADGASCPATGVSCGAPPAKGGCALPDGGCTLVTRSECETESGPYRGSFLGDGAECPPEGACLTAQGDCAITTEAACTASPGLFEGEYLGDATACPATGACRDVPCPRALETLCAEATEVECAAAGGTFDPGGVCDPTRTGDSCPLETACDRFDGTLWYDSCGDRVVFSLERDELGRPLRGRVRRSGAREIAGEWSCPAGEDARSVEVRWSDGRSEVRSFEVFDGIPFFVDPGPDRLPWSAFQVAEDDREQAPVEKLSKGGALELELEVANCGVEPVDAVGLLWRGEGRDYSAEPPDWIATSAIRMEPAVLPPAGRGLVRLGVRATDAVELGDWISVRASGPAGLLRSGHRFIQVREKVIEHTGLVLETYREP